MPDVYQMVTDKIISQLEEGTVPWRKPWRSPSGATGGPISFVSRKPYRGINTLLLHPAMHSFSSSEWLTFKQADALKAKVRAGSKGTRIVFWKMLTREQENGKDKQIPFLRYFTVFNTDQVDNLKLKPGSDVAGGVVIPAPFNPIEEAEAVILAMPQRPTIQHVEAQAYYSPLLDYVNMPPKELFAQGVKDQTKEHAYYATLFHELGHSTAHEDRLNRHADLPPAPFGSDTYSREELVAELTSAYLCAHTDIEPVSLPSNGQAAAYIASWLRALRADNRSIVIAASQAQKAADFILNVTYQNGEQNTDA